MLPASTLQTGDAGKTNKRERDKMLPFDELGDAAIALWHTAAQNYDIIITTCQYGVYFVQKLPFTLSKIKPCRPISMSLGRQLNGPGVQLLIMRFTHAQEAPSSFWSEILLLFYLHSMSLRSGFRFTRVVMDEVFATSICPADQPTEMFI